MSHPGQHHTSGATRASTSGADLPPRAGAYGTGKPKTFYAGLGYQYIKNKFGNQPSLPGTKVSAPSLRFEAHF